jgi:outer membrane immunogenic protein
MRFVSLAVLGAALILGTASQSSAADMSAPVYKAAPGLIAYNWTGFYAGGHIGGGWAQDDVTLAGFTPPPSDLPLGSVFNGNRDGFLGGAQIGFNWQAPASPWLWGVEAQWSWTNARAASTLAGGVSTTTGYASTDWYANVAARVGYTWDRSALYLKGGAAFMGAKYSATTNFGGGTFPSDTFSDTRTGWMVGAGFEQAFAGNWSWNVEYNYMDFGSKNFNLTTAGLGSITTIEADTNIHVVKLGLNYRFGYGAMPVVAKY